MDYASSAVAERYVEGRRLSESALATWLTKLSSVVPPDQVRTILDVGCGTGRFAGAMARHFGALVHALDPSAQMLAKARSLDPAGIAFHQGRAECLPYRDGTIDLIFLSQTYHHLEKLEHAMMEFRRALRHGGYLCIRNSTLDRLGSVPYLRFFPTAHQVNERLLPTVAQILTDARDNKFAFVAHRIVNQQHAESLAAYLPRIRQRSLTDLERISDGDFAAGLAAITRAVREEPEYPVTEDIDLFVFRRR